MDEQQTAIFLSELPSHVSLLLLYLFE